MNLNIENIWQFPFCSLPERQVFNFFYAPKDHAFYIMKIEVEPKLDLIYSGTEYLSIPRLSD